MARQLRVQPPGGVHHITARGNRRQPIFIDDIDRRAYLDLVAEAATRYACRVHAFCLMTNHVHLVMEDGESELSRMLRHVHGVYAQRFNRRHDRTGHVFERRFSNSLLEIDSYLVVAAEYVHRNPLEAAMVRSIDEYPWSSYPAYLGHRPVPDFLETSMVLEYYGRDRELLRTSTERPRRAGGKESELDRRNPAPVLGSGRFVEAATATAEPNSETLSSIRKCGMPFQRSTMDVIAGVVASTIGVDLEQIHLSVRGHRNDGRSVAIYVAHRVEGLPLNEISNYFALTSLGAITMCSRRLEARFDEEPELRLLVERIERVLTSHASASEDPAPVGE